MFIGSGPEGSTYVDSRAMYVLASVSLQISLFHLPNLCMCRDLVYSSHLREQAWRSGLVSFIIQTCVPGMQTCLGRGGREPEYAGKKRGLPVMVIKLAVLSLAWKSSSRCLVVALGGAHNYSAFCFYSCCRRCSEVVLQEGLGLITPGFIERSFEMKGMERGGGRRSWIRLNEAVLSK